MAPRFPPTGSRHEKGRHTAGPSIAAPGLRPGAAHRPPTPAGRGRRLAPQPGHHRGSRGRDQPSQPAQPTRLQPAGRHPARAHRPPHQPQQPALEPARGDGGAHRLAAHASPGRCPLAAHGPSGHAAAGNGRPPGLSLRLRCARQLSTTFRPCPCAPARNSPTTCSSKSSPGTTAPRCYNCSKPCPRCKSVSAVTCSFPCSTWPVKAKAPATSRARCGAASPTAKSRRATPCRSCPAARPP